MVPFLFLFFCDADFDWVKSKEQSGTKVEALRLSILQRTVGLSGCTQDG